MSQEKFEVVVLLEKPMLFMPVKNDSYRIPTSLHKYDIRYDDDYEPERLERRVDEKFYGTVLCKEEVELSGGYVSLDEDSIDWIPMRMTVSAFYEKTLDELGYLIRTREVSI